MRDTWFLWFVIGLVTFVAVSLLVPVRGSVPLQAPERMILTGIPPWGPTRWRDERGATVPAGCGPEAARMLLAYYDRRYGYGRLAREDPDGVIAELHRRMGTITVSWQGKRQGLTWPWAFISGLRAYIEARYPGGVRLGSLDADLTKVFETSVQLVQRGVPHVILFDWGGKMGILPNHYAVVVGYNREGGRRELVINPGWGYDFEVLDMGDPAVAPASLVWIEKIYDPPDAAPGFQVASSAHGMWVLNEAGQVQLRPVLRLHNDPQSTVRWPISTRTEFPVPGADDLAVVSWDSQP